jgi:PAS domain S-box-containing protein
MVTRRESGWESERLIGGAIEAAPIAFTVLLESGRYVAANRAAARLTGYTRGELLGLTTSELSDDPERTSRVVAKAFETGSGSGIRRVRRKNGTVFSAEYRLAPASLGRDRLVVAAWWPEDPTLETGGADPADTDATSLLRAQERVLGVAFQHAPIAVTVSDGDGNYLALNDRACAITGYTRSELFELGAFGIVLSPGRPSGSLVDLPGIRAGIAELRTRDGSTTRVVFRAATTEVGSQEVRIGVWWEAPEGEQGSPSGPSVPSR